MSSDICLTLKNYKIFTIKNFLIYSTHFIVGISIPSTENFLVLFGSRSSGFNVINWMVPAPSLVSYISYNKRNCVQQPKMIILKEMYLLMGLCGPILLNINFTKFGNFLQHCFHQYFTKVRSIGVISSSQLNYYIVIDHLPDCTRTDLFIIKQCTTSCI